MISIEQIKAARALLGWSQADLAKKSGYALPTLNNLERKITAPRGNTLLHIRQALEKGGVQFIDSTGVRLVKQVLDIKMHEGQDSLRKMYDDIYKTLKDTGGEVLLSGISERLFLDVDKDAVYHYIDRIRQNGKIRNQVLYCEGDEYFLETKDPLAEWRWIPKHIFGLVPMFIYGDKHAIVVWDEPVRVVITQNEAIAETYRRQFKANWESARRVPENLFPNKED